MKIILTIVYSLGVVWNTLYIAYNVGKLPLLNLLWPAVILVAVLLTCTFYGLENKSQNRLLFLVILEYELYIV